MTESERFEHRVLTFITAEHLIEPGDHVLAAVSGGPDSVVLLHLLVSLRTVLTPSEITVLHFDHQLRGEASAEDRRFVEAAAHRLGLPFHCGSGDVADYQRRHRLSLEMAARACRHRFFKESVAHLKAQRLALGHTANDQAEEVLLRLLRGTGPSGLAGMPPATHEGLIRPLLCATRREISAYLHSRNLAFREDPTNLDPFCQRNFLRIEVFPRLESGIHANVVETLSRHARLVRDDEILWGMQMEGLWPKVCSEETHTRVVLRLSTVLAMAPALQRRMLRHAIERLQGHLLGIYTVHIESLLEWIARPARGKTVHLPQGLRAAKEAGALVFSRSDAPPHRPELPQASPQEMAAPGRYVFPTLQLSLQLTEQPAPPAGTMPPASRDVAWLDADRVCRPLSLRFWKPGDRFQPMGLSGRKKVQDFFVDLKVPREERARIPLLCDREKICWVVGYRLDERVRVTRETKRLLVVERQPCAG